MEEHKKKLFEDTRLGALAGKVSKETLEDVIWESLKTLLVKEVQRKTTK